MTTRVTGTLKSATGMNISTGPPVRDDLKEVSQGMPPGGATGQVLTKSGPGDYDVAWQTPT
jgi:hypothetical protein